MRVAICSVRESGFLLNNGFGAYVQCTYASAFFAEFLDNIEMVVSVSYNWQ